MFSFVIILEFIWILATTAEEFEPELEPYITTPGYIFIVIAVLLGLAVGILLLLAILKDRKAQAAGVFPQPSTSGQKQSVLDFNRGNNAFSRGKIVKESAKKKFVDRKYPGQQPITSDQVKLFGKGKGGEFSSNASSPSSETDLSEQPEWVVKQNRNALQKLIDKPLPKINALNAFTDISKLRTSRNESVNQSADGTKSAANMAGFTDAISRLAKSSAGNVSKMSNMATRSRMGNDSKLSNIDAKSLVRPTGNANRSHSVVPAKGNVQTNKGWDVTSKYFGQSVTTEGSSKRIVGGEAKITQGSGNEKSF